MLPYHKKCKLCDILRNLKTAWVYEISYFCMLADIVFLYAPPKKKIYIFFLIQKLRHVHYRRGVVNKRQQVSNLIDDTWFMAFPPPPHGPPTSRPPPSRPPKWVPDVGIVMPECLYICLYLSVRRQEMKWSPEECFEDVMLSQAPLPILERVWCPISCSLSPSLSLSLYGGAMWKRY